MGISPDVEHHQRAEAAAVLRPAGTKGILTPRSRRTGDRPAQGDEADATIRKIGEGRALLDLVWSVVLAIQDDDFVFLVLDVDELARAIGLSHDGAGALEFRDEGFDRGMVVGDDGDLDRCSAKNGGSKDHGEAQEGGDAGKHGSIKVSPLLPTRLSGTASRNQTPLKCTFPAKSAFSHLPGSGRGRGQSIS